MRAYVIDECVIGLQYVKLFELDMLYKIPDILIGGVWNYYLVVQGKYSDAWQA